MIVVSEHTWSLRVVVMSMADREDGGDDYQGKRG